MNTLAELEQSVAEKLATAWNSAHPEFADLPPLDIASWARPTEPVPSLPDDWPQFPRERWAVLPQSRVTALVLAEKVIDLGLVAEAGWLLRYGGKVRLS